jgi:predicted nucleotidyltransferase
MSSLHETLRRLADELERLGAHWALIGGLAVGTRAEPRTTRDVDVVVWMADDGSAERLVAQLGAAGYRIRVVLEHDDLKRLATVRLAAPGAGMPVIVDLLFASSGIEDEIVRDAERVEIVSGLTLPVARTGHLIALKILARDDRKRPQDYDDLVALLRYADDGEIDRARRSVRLITERGGHRGRVLEAALEELLASEKSRT